MQRRLVAGGEDAGAFQRDVHAQLPVRQLGGLLDGGDFDLVAGGGHDVAIHRHRGGKAAMHAVIAQQMGVGLHRAQIVDRHDLDIAAAAFHDRPKHQPSDAAEAVNCNPNHLELP